MSQGRQIALAEQTPSFAQTGIDFVAVNPLNHAQIDVYFVVEPGLIAPTALDDAADVQVIIRGVETAQGSVILSQDFVALTDNAGRVRTVLRIVVGNGESFEMQKLILRDRVAERLDPFSCETVFSFKQACPSPFDCACTPETDPKALMDFPVDYYARDFDSYLQALLSFAAERYPEWEHAVLPDQAMMLGELLAALADEFSMIQDNYAREAAFSELKERRSFEALTRILDYEHEREQGSSGYINLRFYEGDRRPAGLASDDEMIEAGILVEGHVDANLIIPFETGISLDEIRGDTRYRVSSLWSDIPAHILDEECPYIGQGGREIYVVGHDLIDPDIRKDTPILIETRPSDPSIERRAFIVILDEPAEPLGDPLLGVSAITRLHWRAEDALPFDLELTD